MFGRRIKLFSLFGFNVHIDASWLLLAILVVWSLASGVFPQLIPGLPTTTYWYMGAAGMVGLFAAIVLHELSHALVARRYGIPMKGITLFIFGGVAQMTEEPPSARSEFWTAAAGPIASMALAALGYLGMSLAAPAGETTVWSSLAGYFGWMNAILAGFNLIPAFPLDGGRMLRAALWHFRKSLRSATRTASRIGGAFGIFLIAWGALTLVSGNIIGGLWIGLIGLFLRQASQQSYQQILVRRALQGEPVERFMKTDPVTIAPDLTVQALVQKYVLTHYHKMFPVVKDDRPIGCVNLSQIKNVPEGQREQTRVADIAEDCNDQNTIEADADATDALARMSRNNLSRLLVLKDGRLAGIVALKDLMRFLSLKIELDHV